ncbi:THO complex subunit 1 [Hibiscus syriacus]|uniref:THO complex subunit 1 n=1 Tax=Hibiscus syriacus TaxID=106335 RepID=A0A6A3D511_HIBSY|nr:THO complex subunit 1 [Hibiscus syriacus]
MSENSRSMQKKSIKPANDVVFCGRILMFLAHFFPLSERSAVNIKGVFNTSNETKYEKDPPEGISVDFNFYKTFWSLQEYFCNPASLSNAPIKWQKFTASLMVVLNTFEAQPLSEEEGTENNLEEEATTFNIKYLTSSKLMGLELKDPSFRRHILLQCLVLFDYLKASGKNDKDSSESMKEEIKSCEDRVKKLLEVTPPKGKDFLHSIEHILDREKNWVWWKRDGCQPFEKQPIEKKTVHDGAKKRYAIAELFLHIVPAVLSFKWRCIDYFIALTPILSLNLNLAKSKLLGINMEEDVLTDWAAQMGCSVGSFPTEYLGLPLGAKKNSEVLWDPVFRNFSAKLAGWKTTCLSLAGRTVLLKSVLTSLPIFFLSLFKMPCKIGKKLNSLMANFLWGDKEGKRRIHWVNWSTVCKPLNCGGLGVLDLNLTNRALLGKWVWKFANDKNFLWKCVLCSKLKVSCNTMSIREVPHSQSSWILRGIANNYLKNDSEGISFRSNSKLIVGNGKSISFWNDVWADECSLKSLFPRIFVLSTNKEGKIAEFGSFEPSGWVWNVQTRRSLSDWELVQWMDLMSKLKDIQLSESSLGPVLGSNTLWSKGVWMGFAPPRVEAFLWQLAHQKVAVKAELVKRGLPLGADILCPLCKEKEESVQHLFISCVVWELWNKLASFWIVSLVLPQDPPILISWGELRVNSIIWKFILGVIFWSIWKVRNAMVFEDSPLDRLPLFFIVRFRLSKWFLAKFPKITIHEDVLIGNPFLANGVTPFKDRVCDVSKWIPPPVDFLKLNVDGAVRLDGSGGGIGGILRDWNGCTLLTFSENVGVGTPPLAELKATKRGIEIFLSSSWEFIGRLIIESDCSSAVEWIQSPVLAPVFFSPLVYQILTLITGKNALIDPQRVRTPAITDYWKPLAEDMDESAGIEAEYHHKNNRVYCWKGLRFSARQDLEGFSKELFRWNFSPPEVRSKFQGKPSDRSKRARKEETKSASHQVEESQIATPASEIEGEGSRADMEASIAVIDTDVSAATGNNSQGGTPTPEPDEHQKQSPDIDVGQEAGQVEADAEVETGMIDGETDP